VSWGPGKSLVIDGIPNLGVTELLADIVRPAKFILVFVELHRAEREARLRTRDGKSQPLEWFEQHSTELQISDLRARADLVVEGDRPVGQLVEEVRLCPVGLVEFVGRAIST
jgi:hypothetical protein